MKNGITLQWLLRKPKSAMFVYRILHCSTNYFTLIISFFNNSKNLEKDSLTCLENILLISPTQKFYIVQLVRQQISFMPLRDRNFLLCNLQDSSMLSSNLQNNSINPMEQFLRYHFLIVQFVRQQASSCQVDTTIFGLASQNIKQ